MMEDFEIYSAFFVYDENLLDGSKGKERPCLVVKSSYLDKEVFYPITGTKRDKHYEIRDWKQAGLKKPSYLVYDKSRDLQALGNPTLTYVGRLSDYDIQRIKSERLLRESRLSYKELTNYKKLNLLESWVSNGSLESLKPDQLVNKAFDNKYATNSVRDFGDYQLYINVDPNFRFGVRSDDDPIVIDVIRIDPKTNDQLRIYTQNFSTKEEAISGLADFIEGYIDEN